LDFVVLLSFCFCLVLLSPSGMQGGDFHSAGAPGGGGVFAWPLSFPPLLQPCLHTSSIRQPF
jgi:hypothetical protein